VTIRAGVFRVRRSSKYQSGGYVDDLAGRKAAKLLRGKDQKGLKSWQQTRVIKADKTKTYAAIKG
jgi:hypothetical protein